MSNPDDTTIPGDDFLDTLAPAPPLPPRVDVRMVSDAPDRLLFFFSGFDPKGATFYHRLFRSGFAQRNASHDETLALGRRHRIGRWASVWTSLWRGAPTPHGARPETMRTRVHFMRWDDIVRKHWRREPRQLARDYWNVYVDGLTSGVLGTIRREAPSAFGLALFPLGVAGASLLAGVPVVGGLVWLTHLLALLPAIVVGLLAGFAGWRALARWIDCEWLVRLYAFMRQKALGEIPALEERLDEMATRVDEAVEARMRQPGAAPLREVMFVGYSSGTVIAATVMARALPRLADLVDSRRTRNGATLSLITLGNCIPIAAEWPAARALRNELEILSESPLLTWHDYSASSDRAAFWRTTPWQQPAAIKAHQASPAFKTGPDAWQFAAIRRDRRESHLQYLRPPRDRGDADVYDFFRLACGPRTLAERHSDIKAKDNLRD